MVDFAYLNSGLTWFRGNPGSPGIAKFKSSARFITSFCASRAVAFGLILVRQSLTKRMP